MAGEMILRTLKEQMPGLSADDHGVAVTRKTMLKGRSRTEVFYGFDFKGAPVFPDIYPVASKSELTFT